VRVVDRDCYAVDVAAIGTERLILVAVLCATFVLQQSHSGALERLPKRDRDTLRYLLRGQAAALVLMLLIVPLELSRMYFWIGLLVYKVV
jgi:hypothetical protein